MMPHSVPAFHQPQLQYQAQEDQPVRPASAMMFGRQSVSNNNGIMSNLEYVRLA
jgi:hypothetical protein